MANDHTLRRILLDGKDFRNTNPHCGFCKRSFVHEASEADMKKAERCIDLQVRLYDRKNTMLKEANRISQAVFAKPDAKPSPEVKRVTAIVAPHHDPDPEQTEDSLTDYEMSND